MEHADTTLWAIIGLNVLGMMVVLAMLARMFRKAGPNEALVVYGFRKDIRIRIASGTLVFPIVETCKMLSLEVMALDVAPPKSLYTREGVAVTVAAVALVRVKRDPESIATAASQLLTKTPNERVDLIRLVMEGHLRGIISQVTAEQILREPQVLGEQMRSAAAGDMSKMGLEMISFTLNEEREGNKRSMSRMSESA